MKDQQIQFLQEKLAELMNSEEVSFSGQNSYIKSNSKVFILRKIFPNHSIIDK